MKEDGKEKKRGAALLCCEGCRRPVVAVHEFWNQALNRSNVARDGLSLR
jgi:hypothetical protein